MATATCHPDRAHCAKGLCRSCYRKSKETPERKWAWQIKTHYGMTPDDYFSLLARQGGGCAICGTDKCQTGRLLNIDHDHANGEVRGILCGHCNKALGLFQDNPSLLRKAASYLEGGQ